MSVDLSRHNFAGAGIGVFKAAGLDAFGAVGLISLALCVAAFCIAGASAATQDEDWLLQTNGLAKASAPVAARLPTVLILGDSISLGYTPIVTGGAKERTVEIPAGTWTADDGMVVTGPKRVTVATPLDRLVHFTRQ